MFSDQKKTLSDLKDRYEKVYIANNFNLNPTVWKTDRDYIKNSFGINFRESNAYVWQENQGDNIKTYIEYYRSIKNIDHDQLLNKTKEDQSYGAICYEIDNTIVSRDLLDSILQIYFLKNNLENFEYMTYLEIGAGYGRLCKRFADCFPTIKYFIVDGIPESTFISKFYLGESNQNKVIDLDMLYHRTENMNIDVAINIHSFPECNYNDIEWWVKFIYSRKIRYIFYAPNDQESTPFFMPTNNKECISHIFKKYNYRIKIYDHVHKNLNIDHHPYSVPFFLLEQNNLDYPTIL